MYPETPNFDEWASNKGFVSEEETMKNGREKEEEEAKAALETLQKYVRRLEEEKTLYTSSLVGMYGTLSESRPGVYTVAKLAEDLVTAEDSGSATDRSIAMAKLREALKKVK